MCIELLGKREGAMENEEGECVWPSARRIRPKQHHTLLYDDDHVAHNAFWL